MTTKKTQRIVLALVLAPWGSMLTAQQTEEPPADRQEAARPSDAGRTDAGVAFRAGDPERRKLAEPEPLRVDAVEVNELAEGTHAGKPGDLLLTVSGAGFAATSKNPTVRLAEGELVLEDTLTDLAGRTLFVIISREEAARIERLRFSSLTIVNPGGHADGEFGQVRVETTPERLSRPAEGAAKARLVYRDGEFLRELVEDTDA